MLGRDALDVGRCSSPARRCRASSSARKAGSSPWPRSRRRPRRRGAAHRLAVRIPSMRARSVPTKSLSVSESTIRSLAAARSARPCPRPAAPAVPWRQWAPNRPGGRAGRGRRGRANHGCARGRSSRRHAAGPVQQLGDRPRRRLGPKQTGRLDVANVLQQVRQRIVGTDRLDEVTLEALRDQDRGHLRWGQKNQQTA